MSLLKEKKVCNAETMIQNEGWLQQFADGTRRRVVPLISQVGAACAMTSVRAVTSDADAHIRAIEALADRYPLDAFVTQMDLSVEAEALGTEVAMPETGMPYVARPLLRSAHDVHALVVPSLAHGRLPQYLRAVAGLSASLQRPVVATCTGPLTLASLLCGMSSLQELLHSNPTVVEQLLEKCILFLQIYAGELKRVGADGLLMAEPVAGLLPNDDCYRYSSVYIRRLADAVQDARFPLILHNCGNRGQCTDAMVRSGACALHFGNAADMVQALQTCPSHLVVMGNADPVGVLSRSTPDEVYDFTLRLLQRTSEFPNFVLSTGCDTPAAVSPESVDAYLRAVSRFNHFSGRCLEDNESTFCDIDIYP